MAIDSETAAFADIVLPATMFLEHDDFYTASGHTFFQVTKAVIEPPGAAFNSPRSSVWPLAIQVT